MTGKSPLMPSEMATTRVTPSARAANRPRLVTAATVVSVELYRNRSGAVIEL
jgi:hypothetical protein